MFPFVVATENVFQALCDVFTRGGFKERLPRVAFGESGGDSAEAPRSVQIQTCEVDDFAIGDITDFNWKEQETCLALGEAW